MATKSKPRIAIIAGSTRPNRKAGAVARWALEVLSLRQDATFEIVDLRDYPLPLLDEPVPPSLGKYGNVHTRIWAAKIRSFDGFILVTPEYNHSTSAALKNALDYLFAEWNNKAVGFISYGSAGGVRAVEQLRAIVGELMMADVRTQVALPLATEFENYSEFKPSERSAEALVAMADQVVEWTNAMAGLRPVAGPGDHLKADWPLEVRATRGA